MTEILRLAEQIADSGLERVFGLTGSGPSLDLVDSLSKLGVDFVRTQFEGSAAIMAGTTARLSGRSGVAITIKGPGLTNLIPGLAFAWFESQPVVAICEAYAYDAPESKAHKRLDQHQLLGAVTKRTSYLTGDSDIYSRHARLAEAEVPGPVAIQLAEGVAKSSESVSHECALDAGVVDFVQKSSKPVLIVGSLAVRKRWSDQLEQLRVPVFTTAAAKGVMDETHPYSAGVFTGVGLELAPESSLLEQADAVIGIGLRPAEVLETRKYAAVMVNLDTISCIPGSDAFGFCATSGEVHLKDVFAALSSKEWGAETVAEAMSNLRLGMNCNRFLPWHAYELIAQRFSQDCRLVLDTGNFCTVGEHAWRAKRADLCLLSGQGRYMGTALSMAIAAALHDATVPTIVVCGDGGIGPLIGELRLSMERELPILVILMTDGRFASVAGRAIRSGLGLAALTMTEPSWFEIMSGFGLWARKAADEREFESALHSWKPDDGPGYIELKFDPDAYERMVASLRR